MEYNQFISQYINAQQIIQSNCDSSIKAQLYADLLEKFFNTKKLTPEQLENISGAMQTLYWQVNMWSYVNTPKLLN